MNKIHLRHYFIIIDDDDHRRDSSLHVVYYYYISCTGGFFLFPLSTAATVLTQSKLVINKLQHSHLIITSINYWSSAGCTEELCLVLSLYCKN
jgi:hypothetical protein